MSIESRHYPKLYIVAKEFIIIFRMLLAAVLLDIIHFLLWIKDVLCKRQ